MAVSLLSVTNYDYGEAEGPFQDTDKAKTGFKVLCGIYSGY